MLIKSASSIATAILTLSVVGMTALSAQANPLPTKGETLLSQLPGHDVYKKEDQMQFSDYGIGRVRGKVGNIVMVELLKYGAFPGYISLDNGQRITHVDVEAAAEPGDDVLIDLKTLSVMQAHPVWLTRLKLKEVAAVERSAINFESSAPVSLPPVQPSAPVAPAPVAPTPVRGLW
ncbi:hypothetical protein [Synechocystis sp. LKSZ1]|uniref:hypothetical protein n=1 Tax=Synechocystis sp. LKSZ1 TaxID=3144951 RepID=UPI00336BEC4F